jgi:predicted transposase YdaD
MASHENSHDKLFKSALADPADAVMELRAVLPPALASQLDFSTLTPLPGTFVDEAMRGSQADLLFSVRRANDELLLYVLMEHKSEVDRWTLLQLLRYMVRIWEQYVAQTSSPSAPGLRLGFVWSRSMSSSGGRWACREVTGRKRDLWGRSSL